MRIWEKITNQPSPPPTKRTLRIFFRISIVKNCINLTSLTCLTWGCPDCSGWAWRGWGAAWTRGGCAAAWTAGSHRPCRARWRAATWRRSPWCQAPSSSSPSWLSSAWSSPRAEPSSSATAATGKYKINKPTIENNAYLKSVISNWYGWLLVIWINNV